jgi:hypothetical protein
MIYLRLNLLRITDCSVYIKKPAMYALHRVSCKEILTEQHVIDLVPVKPRFRL